MMLKKLPRSFHLQKLLRDLFFKRSTLEWLVEKMSSTEASYAKGAKFDGDDQSDAILTPGEEQLHAAARQASGCERKTFTFV